jgi:hypothetical protein
MHPAERRVKPLVVFNVRRAFLKSIIDSIETAIESFALFLKNRFQLLSYFLGLLLKGNGHLLEVYTHLQDYIH